MRATGQRRIDALGVDLAAMTALPPIAPVVGLANRVRLGRDYYVRVDTNDYSVDPHVIGRFVDVTASPTRVVATCDQIVVADHARCWAHRQVLTDPAHKAAAARLRAAFTQAKTAREDAARRAARHGVRRHDDGTLVQLRALPDYDALFGVDFNPAPAAVTAGPAGPATAGGQRGELVSELVSGPVADPGPGAATATPAGAVTGGAVMGAGTAEVQLPRTLVLPPSAVTQ